MLWFGGMWALGIWIRKAIKCFKFSLMAHTSKSMEDRIPEGDLNCGVWLKGFQRRISVYCLAIILAITC